MVQVEVPPHGHLQVRGSRQASDDAAAGCSSPRWRPPHRVVRVEHLELRLQGAVLAGHGVDEVRKHHGAVRHSCQLKHLRQRQQRLAQALHYKVQQRAPTGRPPAAAAAAAGVAVSVRRRSSRASARCALTELT
eukprot:scaffold2215_cov353-Prasinococcus_capsulatus_cf.AAC.6